MSTVTQGYVLLKLVRANINYCSMYEILTIPYHVSIIELVLVWEYCYGIFKGKVYECWDNFFFFFGFPFLYFHLIY
jgi:hypothetical protein